MYVYTHTHTNTHNEYYLAIKKNKIMPFAATWVDLEIIKDSGLIIQINK